MLPPALNLPPPLLDCLTDDEDDSVPLLELPPPLLVSTTVASFLTDDEADSSAPLLELLPPLLVSSTVASFLTDDEADSSAPLLKLPSPLLVSSTFASSTPWPLLDCLTDVEDDCWLLLELELDLELELELELVMELLPESPPHPGGSHPAVFVIDTSFFVITPPFPPVMSPSHFLHAGFPRET